MRTRHRLITGVVVACLALAVAAAVASVVTIGQTAQPDWVRLQDETMAHYQALLRFDTSDPPGREQPAVDYLKAVLERERIPVETFTLEPNRPNVVARGRSGRHLRDREAALPRRLYATATGLSGRAGTAAKVALPRPG